MSKLNTVSDVLEAADKLSAEEQEAIVDILRKRLIDLKRKELVKNVKASQREFLEGLCRPGSPDEIISEITS